MTEQVIQQGQKPLTSEFENNYMSFAAEDRKAALRKRLEARVAQEKPVEQQKDPQEADDEGGFFSAVGDVASDVGRGIINAPRRLARGVTGAMAEVAEIGEDIDRALNSPVLQIINEKGEFDLDVMFKDEADAKFGGDAPGLEELFKSIQPDKPLKESVTGQAIEGITQFMVGFKGVDKAFKAAKIGKAATTAGKVAQTATKGAIADMLAFDEQEARLSTLVESVPALQNPVTEYLKGEEDDSVLEAKLKQGLEGMGLGLIVDSFVPAVRAIRNGKRLKKKIADAPIGKDDLVELPEQEAAGVGIESKEFAFLGDPDANKLVLAKKVDPKTPKLNKAVKETADITADEVAKGGKKKAVDPAQEFEINFARIDGPEDIKNLMDEFVNRPELKASIQKARRGVKTNEETLKAATDIDGFNELMLRREGQALNAETITAARKVYYDTTEKLMEAAKKAAEPTATTIDQYNFRKMVAVHHAVQKEFMGMRAEAGRALQAWKIPVGKTGAENARAIEDLMNSFGGNDTAQSLARRITSLGNNLNTNQINAITQKAGAARTLDAVTEAWTLGLLTNPTTHVVNLSSNMLTSVTLGAERAFAALNKGGPVTLKEAGAYFSGLLQAQKEAIKNSARAFKTGEVGIGLGKIELPHVRSTSREVLDAQGMFKPFGYAMDYYGKMVGFAGNALAAGDEYSKTILYKAQLKALATRQGIASGLDGDDLRRFVAETAENPTNTMRADATQFANYGTFTRELGQTGQNIQRVISRNPGLRFVVPFVRTPANIFKFTFERTPLGLASRKMREDIAAGGLRQQMALAKIGLGSSIMWIGTDLSLNGKITGAGPTDPKKRGALRRTGWQPYSVKIGDTYYSYGRFEPVATVLGMSADLAEIMSNYEAYDMEAQREVDELSTAIVAAVGNQVVGKTFLSGFADLTEVLSDPKRYSGQFLQRYAGSFVPAGVAGIERATDPQMEFVFNKIDAMKARIPGLSDEVPNRLNVYGEEVKTFYPTEKSMAGATAQRIASMFNPVYYSSEKADSDLDKFMLKNGFSVNMPSKAQSFDGIRIDLREHPEIYHRLVKLRAGHDLDSTLINARYGGLTLKEYLTDMVKGESLDSQVFFSNFTDADEQQNYITRIVTDYQTEAKKQLLVEFPVLEQIITEEQAKQQKLLGNRGEEGLIQTKPIP